MDQSEENNKVQKAITYKTDKKQREKNFKCQVLLFERLI